MFKERITRIFKSTAAKADSLPITRRLLYALSLAASIAGMSGAQAHAEVRPQLPQEQLLMNPLSPLATETSATTHIDPETDRRAAAVGSHLPFIHEVADQGITIARTASPHYPDNKTYRRYARLQAQREAERIVNLVFALPLPQEETELLYTRTLTSPEGVERLVQTAAGSFSKAAELDRSISEAGITLGPVNKRNFMDTIYERMRAYVLASKEPRFDPLEHPEALSLEAGQALLSIGMNNTKNWVIGQFDPQEARVARYMALITPHVMRSTGTELSGREFVRAAQSVQIIRETDAFLVENNPRVIQTALLEAAENREDARAITLQITRLEYERDLLIAETLAEADETLSDQEYAAVLDSYRDIGGNPNRVDASKYRAALINVLGRRPAV